MATNLTDYQKGFLLGLLVGEGHFGGDSKQPHITLRMHIRHEPLLRWVQELLPGGELYGPYCYDNRHHFQLMFRGRYLREVVAPLLQSLPWRDVDPHTHARFSAMIEKYKMARTVPPEGSPWNEDLLGERPLYGSLKELLENTLPPEPWSPGIRPDGEVERPPAGT